MKITCPDCRQHYEVDETYLGRSVSCQSCGKAFDILKPVEAEEKKRCPACGEEILAIAKKCKHCGEFLGENGLPVQKIKRDIYILLALFFGSIGAHNIYAHEYASGAGKVSLFIIMFILLAVAPPFGAFTVLCLLCWILFDIWFDPNLRKKNRS